jgi:hypothetical protein
MIKRSLRPELGLEPRERLRVRASARGGEVGLRQEGIHRVGQRRDGIANGPQAPDGSLRGGHRRECVVFAVNDDTTNAHGIWWPNR